MESVDNLIKRAKDVDEGTSFWEAEEVVRELAQVVEKAREVLESYEGWHRDSPEDSWRLERDVRNALGMPEVREDEDDEDDED